jgi:hypothetical protein
LRRAEEGAEMFRVFRVKKHDFTQKKNIFSNFRGGAGCTTPPFPPPPPVDPPLPLTNAKYLFTGIYIKYKLYFIGKYSQDTIILFLLEFINNS